MCGFAGILRYKESGTEITAQLLTEMGNVIYHRGPDDGGIFLNEQRTIGLSFRRLSIIDLSPAGHQPMSTADGRLTLVFNGEIYNHQKLRAELEAAGYTYRSRTDTETILYSYLHWGERFVEKFEGMFAIALWDSAQRRLFVYRDRVGIKPQYYADTGREIVFGSEIKALLRHPAISPAVDERALYHYLTFIHTPAPDTLFQGVRKLEPGHYLTIDADGAIADHEYWDLRSAPKPDFDFNDEEAVAGRIRGLLIEAIEKRMMSDVPFGVFLSGGIDSSANVALMAALMNRPVDTFTVAIKGQEDTNEFQWARRIAKQFGTNHKEILIDDGGFLDLLPLIVHHQDEPLADPVCFPLYHVSKLARDNGTIVIQVGEGSDEQFSGYQSYIRAHALQRYGRRLAPVPRFLRKAAYSAMIPLLKQRRVDYRQNVIRNMMEGSPVFWGNAVAFYEREKQSVISDAFRRRMAGMESSFDLAARRIGMLREAGSLDELQEMIYWELKNRLAELLLMRVDKITMAASIEARVPFLDHKMLEFSFHIPESLKIKNGTTKYILKKALRGVLPDDIIDRKKIGFAGSGKNMLTPEIFRHAKSLLLTSNHGYFDKDYLERLLGEYEQKKINYTPQIWTLYNFELWHRQWIENRPEPS